MAGLSSVGTYLHSFSTSKISATLLRTKDFIREGSPLSPTYYMTRKIWKPLPREVDSSSEGKQLEKPELQLATRFERLFIRVLRD